MTKWTKIMIGTVLLSGTFSRLAAQQTITLKEAIEFALQNKAEAKKSALDVKNSDYQIMQAKAGALPKITGSATLIYNPILQESALPGEIFGAPGTTILVPFGQKWNSVAGVNLSQAIFNQQVFVGLKAAKSTKEFYQLNESLTQEQIIERVSNAYYQVYTAQEKLKTFESNYTSTEKARNIIKSLFDNGLAKKIDLDRTNVNLTNIKTVISQNKNAVSQAENALKFYMGMAINKEIAVVPADMDITPHLLDDTVSTDERVEIKILTKTKQLLEFQKKADEAAYYPTANLNAGYNWQGQGNRFPLTNGRSNGVNWSDYSTISLGLNIPIFNGFATKARVAQSQIAIEKNDVDIEDKKLSLDLDYQNAKSQISNSLSAIDNQKANVTLAESVLSNSKSNYQYGLATLTDLLDAENSLVQAKNNYTNAVLDYKIAEIQYYKSQGDLKHYIK
ncbi:TolC family protein [Halpernia frigidisoli]|uniref:Outer membrane protein TolC n=1 Tax=Halpernia frigidisoli TaxID=1125876 RepID=A0A1I3DJY6_9FLAO|nr:TolC family protein [Halpernia frigidisoli]SFH87016.1 Outer membrane protein TolC [Halpernia frigidisoli]